jgi:hypothetical protein
MPGDVREALIKGVMTIDKPSTDALDGSAVGGSGSVVGTCVEP